MACVWLVCGLFEACLRLVCGLCACSVYVGRAGVEVQNCLQHSPWWRSVCGQACGPFMAHPPPPLYCVPCCGVAIAAQDIKKNEKQLKALKRKLQDKKALKQMANKLVRVTGGGVAGRKGGCLGRAASRWLR